MDAAAGDVVFEIAANARLQSADAVLDCMGKLADCAFAAALRASSCPRVLELAAHEEAASALRQVITDLAGLTGVLLDQARPLAGQVRDGRLALEIAVIQRMAESLNSGLRQRDPLSERVHHSKPEMLGLALTTALAFPLKRLLSRSGSR